MLEHCFAEVASAIDMGAVRLPGIGRAALDRTSQVIDLVDAVQGRFHIVATGNVSAKAFDSDIPEIGKLTATECPDP